MAPITSILNHNGSQVDSYQKAKSLYIASKYIDAVDLAYIMDTAPAPVGSEPLW